MGVAARFRYSLMTIVPAFAGIPLGMADGSTLRPESRGVLLKRGGTKSMHIFMKVEGGEKKD